MENYQGEIFYLYKVKGKTQKELIAILKSLYNINVSQKQLTTELSRWGYAKNASTRQPLSVVPSDKPRPRAEESLELSRSHPSMQVQRGENDLRRRTNSGNGDKNALNHGCNVLEQVMSYTPPLSLREEQWQGCETIFFHVDKLVQGSFEAGHWRWNGQETLIYSSSKQEEEKALLHSFLNSVEGAHLSIARGELTQAVSHWAEAFQRVDQLVEGQYHDIIPNLIQKINDINEKGQEQVALQLLQHITECAQTYLEGNVATYSLYTTLAHIPMNHLPALEARIMSRFKELFEWYQGPRSYNSFVMMVNQGRRLLLRNNNARLEDVLPPVDYYDQTFGISNRRSLDIIALRIEIAYKRRLFVQVENEATILIQRAKLIQNDNWQSCYNLVRALNSFDHAEKMDDKLRELGNWNIFDAERVAIRGFKKQMHNLPMHQGVNNPLMLYPWDFS